MKTPMQEAKEYVLEMLKGDDVSMSIGTYGLIELKLNEMLEKEKEVMESSWNNGHQVGRFEGAKIAEEGFSSFEFYFNETFNTKEK